MGELPISPDDLVPIRDIARDVVGLRVLFVNVFAVSTARGWTLIDAGLYGSAGRIKRWAAEHVADTPPESIVLTHAHFDHVGALDQLAEEWNVPVFAHV